MDFAQVERELLVNRCYFAESLCEYEKVTEYLCDNGAKFAYHFETGEAFLFRGVVVEVFGL